MYKQHVSFVGMPPDNVELSSFRKRRVYATFIDALPYFGLQARFSTSEPTSVFGVSSLTETLVCCFMVAILPNATALCPSPKENA